MAAWMLEPEHIGMQRLPMKVLSRLAGSLSKNTQTRRRHPPIRRVAHHRMPDGGHVHADLMGSAGRQPAFDEAGGASEGAQNTIASEGGFAAAGDDRHLLAIG